MMTSATLDLAMQLISRRSVTPADDGCQALVAGRLASAGFTCTHLRFGDVDNLWARCGTEAPLLVFLGHTDVVPPGPRDAWRSDPFLPELRDGCLFGRGAADMKTSIAAMVVAVERLLAQEATPAGSIAMLLTSDEEGPSIDGTVRVVEWLQQQGTRIDWCLVGEPSSSTRLGDTIKNGRRGSLNGRLTVRGIQGHVAYPALARNPIQLALPALHELAQLHWDDGNEYFPPTSFQFSNLVSGTGAENVIPGVLSAQFNLRYSTQWTESQIKERILAILSEHGLDYTCEWRKSGDPFLTPAGTLLNAVRESVAQLTGLVPQISTGGGTSDGRFIAPLGAEVVELGPINRTIHQVNECVAIQDVDVLTDIYARILHRLLFDAAAR